MISSSSLVHSNSLTGLPQHFAIVDPAIASNLSSNLSVNLSSNIFNAQTPGSGEAIAWNQLLSGLNVDRILLLDPNQDSLSQIQSLLSNYQTLGQTLASLHILSHGQPGEILLGNHRLSTEQLQNDPLLSQQIQTWGQILAPDGDLLVYGCHVGAGEAGQTLLQTLSQLTQADVAASTNATGSADLGGDWLLEVSTGPIDAAIAPSTAFQTQYRGLLAPGTSFSYSTFSGDISQLQFNGSTSRSGSTLQLTPDTPFQNGSAYYRTPVLFDANTSFNTQFQFQVTGNQGSGGADGFTFVLQNNGLTALGGSGGSLGYEGISSNAIAIKFDTFQGAGEPNNNHVGVSIGTTLNTTPTLTAAPLDLNGGQAVNAWIDYNGATNTLQLFLANSTTKPSSALLSYSIDLPTILGSQAYAGFTAGTGAFTNTHAIQTWQFSSTGTGGSGGGNGLTAQYYDNIDFSGFSVTRTDPTVNFDWGLGSPTPSIGPDTFSARWSGQVEAPNSGAYTFLVTGDDGVRLWVNNQLVIDRFIDQAPTPYSTSPITLNAGQKYDIRFDYYERGGGAVARLEWAGPGITRQVIPQDRLFSSTNTANQIALGASDYNASENAGPLRFQINRSGDLSQTAAVDYQLVNGSALAGQDYTNTSQRVTFAVGQATANVDVPLINDSLVEPTETLSVILANPQGAILGGQTSATLTINDDDGSGSNGLRAEYYNEIDFTSLALTRTDATVNFDWGLGAPDPVIGADTFSVRWAGQVAIPTSGAYTFWVSADDGVRLWINNQLVIDRFIDQAPTTYSTSPISLTAGQRYDIRLDYYERGGGAVARLEWSGPGISRQVIPQSQLFVPGSGPQGTIALANGGVQIDEGAGFARIQLVRTGDSSGSATVTYVIDPTGTNPASLNQDYQIPGMSVSFAPGQTLATVDVPILEDSLDEPNETFRFGMSGVTGASLGTIRNSIIEIVDNDVSSGSGNGLYGEYFDSLEFQDFRVARTDTLIDFNWGTGSPNAQIGVDTFSVRWTGQVEAPVSDTYIFRVTGDDGVRLWVNGQQLVDAWRNQGPTAYEGAIALMAGQRYDIRLEYYENTGGATAKLEWRTQSNSIPLQVVPTNRLYSTPGVGQFAVSNTTLQVNEATGTLAVRVNRIGGSAGTVSVNYATQAGTATTGVDYTPAANVLTFAPGETSKLVNLAIANDTAIERNETLALVLSNPTGGAAIATGQGRSDILILDDDTGTFATDTLWSGLRGPTAIDFTPDGRYMFIAQKEGIVRIRDMQTGTNLATPFIDLSSETNIANDRGLIGLAIHPNFSNGQPYIYLAYTYDPPETQGQFGNAGPDGSGNRPSRVVRIRVDLSQGVPRPVATTDPDYKVILLGKNSLWQYTSRPDLNFTDSAYYDLPPSGIVNGTTITAPTNQIEPGTNNIRDYLATDADSHTIGALTFGADGALYVSNGDGVSYNNAGSGDARSRRVQDVNNLSGKILRIDPLTGQGLSNNPFWNGDANSNRSKVWDLGLRNPFRTAVQPGTGNLWIGDVGWYSWDEINRSSSGGRNFGWPYFEGGPKGISLRTPQISTTAEAQAFYATNPTVTAPVEAIAHFDGAGNFLQVAVVAGDFYTGTSYPNVYRNALFFTNASPDNPSTFTSAVYALTVDASGNPETPKLFRPSESAGIVQMTMGPDGFLYFVNVAERNSPTGFIGRWRAV